MQSLWWQTWIEDLQPSKYGVTNLVSRVAEILREKGLASSKKIGYVSTYGFPQQLLEVLKRNCRRLRNLRDEVSNLKMIKSSEEKELMRRTTSIASKAMVAGCESVADGVSEHLVAGKIDGKMMEEGAHDVAFYTMVVSGERTHLKHSPPLDRKMKRGDMVFIDLGASVFGYNSDLCRTLTVGTPDEEQKQTLDAAIQIHDKSSKLIRPNSSVEKITNAAISAAKEYSLEDEFYIDGHGIGTSMFDPPSIHPGATGKLSSNITIAYEPMIFSKSLGTVSFEDDYLIDSSGITRLTNCPREFS